MSNTSAAVLEASEPMSMVLPLREGFPLSHFLGLVREIGIPESRLADLIGIAVRTLARRKEEGRFRTDESERLWRVERVLAMAVSLLGSTGGRDWLLRACPALQGNIPLNLCDTEAGARQIELVLSRLAEGIPQ